MKKKSIYLASVMVAALFVAGGGPSYEASANGLTLISPNGGEVVPSGSIYPVQWGAPLEMVSFNLKYSMDNGKTWKPIASEIADTSYDWDVPTPPKNKKKCFVKVIGYDVSQKKLGADKSDRPFTIEVLRVLSPNGGETLKPGGKYTITWLTNGTKNPVETVKLLYTTNGGTTWKKITTLPENPGGYTWTIPDVPKIKSKCRVKVVVKDGKGNTVGQDVSDSNLAIEPISFVFAEVTGTETPIIAVATDGEDAIGALGERDAGGNPISITGAVYSSGLGDAGELEVDMEGLPTSFTDFSEYRAVFENYTESTVDVSIYDSDGNLVVGPITVDVDPEDLTEIKELFNAISFGFVGGQTLGLDLPTECEIHVRLTNILMWSSYAFSWAGCVISTLTGDILVALPSCFSALLNNMAALTDEEAADIFSFFLDEGLCGMADFYSCLSILANAAAILIGGCADVVGSWDFIAEGTVTCTIDGETDTETFRDTGTLPIAQDYCKVSWVVPGTPFKRKGKIKGNEFRASGIMMYAEGVDINFTENIYTAKGLVCGDEIYVKGSGRASGTIFYGGFMYRFTCKAKDANLLTRSGFASPLEVGERKEAIRKSPLIILNNSTSTPCFAHIFRGKNGAR
jgi:hypothetical protein